MRSAVDDGGARRPADLALAGSILSYNPHIGTDHGLSLMIEHYRERQGSLHKGRLGKI